MSRVPWRVAWLLGWFRFRGWTNRYWREDILMAWLCDHPRASWFAADDLGMCGDCGKVLWVEPSLIVTSQSSNQYHTVEVHW